MASVGTYLNFQGQAEEALGVYAALFGTEVEGVQRFGEVPGLEVPDDERDLVMHAQVRIYGHLVQASDMLASMGHQVRVGNNTTIALDLDDRAECDRLYGALSDGGEQGSGMIEQPWGYWGSCLDRFGVRWMFNAA